ncbi:Adenosylcobinamide-phosphate synthase [Roseibacterium elongatum DSM 19469]|uniref:Cobalamin biosynthesis protein CobD n=1 Tax=Roseicyclus elongatus DSM 19469 TaxID=1294273 RepID=W8S6M1_9RHOB|nr:adenosylcobinamide-phosphate synthase CbiB [Roseibacterium elongatum]AHM04526.1 Adenosylcobinamide-phosphate synthase [Roseibacterium elongatum DSM 19469]
MSFAAAMALALVIDACLGWPDRLYARIGHPVTWIGAVISALETRLNHGPDRRRRVWGGVTVAIVLAVSILPAIWVQSVLPDGWGGVILAGILGWPLIASRALHDYVAAVSRPLASGDLAGARAAVAMLVSRDPKGLDAAAVARAGVESLAENTSDGVVAPLFWGAILGLPGLAGYKAVNTLDSMIGYRNDRYEDFGKVAARMDDALNLIPARLTGLIFVLVSGQRRRAWSVMLRDAGQHRSPNAGWPEAAMAGALGIRVSGPRVYDARVVQEPWVNAGAPDPDAEDMARGLALYLRAMVLCGAGLVTLAWIGG